MKLKRSYSNQTLTFVITLFVFVAAFSLITPFDTLKEAKGLVIVIGIIFTFLLSVCSAFLLGHLIALNNQGKPFTFKDLNPGITFSIKTLDKKEPEKKSLFLDDDLFRYVVSCEEETFLLTDFRSIPEGDYFKDGKTGRIKRVDPDTKDLRN